MSARYLKVTVNGTEQGVDVGSGKWTGTVPSGADVVISASMCVAGPDQCTDTAQTSVRAPYQYTVAGLDTMGGVCAEKTTGGGDWLRTKATCEAVGGKWVVDATKIFTAEGCSTGGAYPSEPPAATPTSKKWLKAVDGRFYRYVGLDAPPTKAPGC